MNSPTTTEQTTTENAASSDAPASELAEGRTSTDTALRCAATVRYDQLRDLPDVDDDPIVTAQRTALLQTLAAIAAAQERAAAGTFGLCTRCGDAIPAGRLAFRPWAATCVACADR